MNQFGILQHSTESVEMGTYRVKALGRSRTGQTRRLVAIGVEEVPLLAHQFSDAVVEYPITE